MNQFESNKLSDNTKLSPEIGVNKALKHNPERFVEDFLNKKSDNSLGEKNNLKEVKRIAKTIEGRIAIINDLEKKLDEKINKVLSNQEWITQLNVQNPELVNKLKSMEIIYVSQHILSTGLDPKLDMEIAMEASLQSHINFLVLSLQDELQQHKSVLDAGSKIYGYEIAVGSFFDKLKKFKYDFLGDIGKTRIETGKTRLANDVSIRR